MISKFAALIFLIVSAQALYVPQTYTNLQSDVGRGWIGPETNVYPQIMRPRGFIHPRTILPRERDIPIQFPITGGLRQQEDLLMQPRVGVNYKNIPIQQQLRRQQQLPFRHDIYANKLAQQTYNPTMTNEYQRTIPRSFRNVVQQPIKPLPFANTEQLQFSRPELLKLQQLYELPVERFNQLRVSEFIPYEEYLELVRDYPEYFLELIDAANIRHPGQFLNTEKEQDEEEECNETEEDEEKKKDENEEEEDEETTSSPSVTKKVRNWMSNLTGSNKE